MTRERPRDAEVRDEGLIVGRQENVLWLHVAVDHATPMGELQCLRHFARDAERVIERELTLAYEPGTQALALDIRHREPEEPVWCLPRVEHGQDAADAGAARQT